MGARSRGDGLRPGLIRAVSERTVVEFDLISLCVASIKFSHVVLGYGARGARARLVVSRSAHRFFIVQTSNVPIPILSVSVAVQIDLKIVVAQRAYRRELLYVLGLWVAKFIILDYIESTFCNKLPCQKHLCIVNIV